jgi:excisionase family DNA binding protein
VHELASVVKRPKMGERSDEHMSIQSTGLSRHEGGGPKPLAVTVKKACKLIGVGNTTMYELIRDGRVKTTTIGRRRLVIYSSLEEMVSGK